MGLDTMAIFHWERRTDSGPIYGQTALSILETGSTIRCVDVAPINGPMAASTKETGWQVTCMARADMRGLMVGAMLVNI
jgi:hypothetical protein